MDRQRKFLRLRRRGACGASQEITRGEAREKKSVGFVDEGQKVPRGAEVKYIDIVLFVVLISAYQCFMYKKVMVLSCDILSL